MNIKEIVRKWTKALESGEYKQTRCLLRVTCGSSVGHCCLGVLCEIVAKEEPKIARWNAHNIFFYAADDDDTELPHALHDQLPWIDMNRLMSMNDKEMLSFKEIAKEIRVQYKNRKR